MPLVLTPFYLAYLNKKHQPKLSARRKSAHLVDTSMISNEKLQESKAVELEDAQDQRTSVEEDKGLMDVADLENEGFIYVY